MLLGFEVVKISAFSRWIRANPSGARKRNVRKHSKAMFAFSQGDCITGESAMKDAWGAYMILSVLSKHPLVIKGLASHRGKEKVPRVVLPKWSKMHPKKSQAKTGKK
ncbi:MAG: hypothetical protein HT580_15280 [Dechloromonas sp.]|nr:MAG: hypothetical protein HT580_15280 [Dechloromonas sp.]